MQILKNCESRPGLKIALCILLFLKHPPLASNVEETHSDSFYALTLCLYQNNFVPFPSLLNKKKICHFSLL